MKLFEIIDYYFGYAETYVVYALDESDAYNKYIESVCVGKWDGKGTINVYEIDPKLPYKIAEVCTH